jgi:hypothetical protein
LNFLFLSFDLSKKFRTSCFGFLRSKRFRIGYPSITLPPEADKAGFLLVFSKTQHFRFRKFSFSASILYLYNLFLNFPVNNSNNT